jgi:hypothetical protein
MRFPRQPLQLLVMPTAVYEANGMQALAVQDQQQAKIRTTKGSRILFEQHEAVRLR